MKRQRQWWSGRRPLQKGCLGSRWMRCSLLLSTRMSLCMKCGNNSGRQPMVVDHHAHPISPAVSASNHDNTADTLVAESTRPSSSKTGNKVIGSEQNPINVKDEDVKDEEEHAVSMHMVAREKRATPDPSRQREQPVPKTSQPHRKQSPVVDVSKNRSRNPKSRKGSADVAIGSKLNKHVPQGYADSFQAHSLENSILLKKPKQLQTP
ncbi:uncharacterized protein CC84DRAFT_292353 [Paraphaeosphaeria sporulosa]|uniref:Uncharacterized protein n=1 Tax=Paraphaeosphaeria sporulosa TaxID=1460663 RepID=A0A177BZ90_9PLEO|nr:uncharacterized protein CC84DRAFT_292353 [Paraphaeosphaeria sporulosa]OAG00301.1 hypothetical protein CC84DRAFT_292353 [Paraphaeosphaeria sporulosa]